MPIEQNTEQEINIFQQPNVFPWKECDDKPLSCTQ